MQNPLRTLLWSDPAHPEVPQAQSGSRYETQVPGPTARAGHGQHSLEGHHGGTGWRTYSPILDCMTATSGVEPDVRIQHTMAKSSREEIRRDNFPHERTEHTQQKRRARTNEYLQGGMVTSREQQSLDCVTHGRWKEVRSMCTRHQTPKSNATKHTVGGHHRTLQ